MPAIDRRSEASSTCPQSSSARRAASEHCESPENGAGKECVLPTIARAHIGRRVCVCRSSDLGLLRKVMRLESPSRISVTVALQDHSSRIGQVSNGFPARFVVFRKGTPGFSQ
jgi:hypothetical protein